MGLGFCGCMRLHSGSAEPGACICVDPGAMAEQQHGARDVHLNEARFRPWLGAGSMQ